MRFGSNKLVIPAKAGIQLRKRICVPAFAGMTKEGVR